jgi:hypothetical protein
MKTLITTLLLGIVSLSILGCHANGEVQDNDSDHHASGHVDTH